MDPKLPRVAYLTGRYPLASLTFVLREVEALRALGVSVKTCSLWQTPTEQHPGPSEKRAAATTFYVRANVRQGLVFLRAQARALRSPRRYFRALGLAWQTRATDLPGLVEQAAIFGEATVLAHYIEAERIDHLHNHFVGRSATVAMLTSALTGIPYSFTLHGPSDLREPQTWKLGEKTARAKFVATISSYAMSHLMLLAEQKDWPKIRIIHCGVHPALYSGETPEHSGDSLRLLFAGRLVREKGLRILLDAVTALAPRLPHLQLTIVGDGPDRTELERLAGPLGERVVFLGTRSQDEVAEIMQVCDVVVLPSLAEGVPVVLMEAMASGKPVIATQVAGTAELVEDGEHGFLVSPGSSAELENAILRLGSEPGQRGPMGRQGRDKVTREFDVQVEASRLLSLFCGVDGGAVRPAPYTGHATQLPLVRATTRPRSFERFVFIAGLHRSGTTLLEHLLHAHFDVTVLRAPVPENEGQHLQDVYKSARAHGGPGRFAFRSNMNPTALDVSTARAARERLLCCWTPWTVGESTTLVEKSPPNLTRIHWLRTCFPGARFIILTRDPRAVACATRKWSRASDEELIRHWDVAHAIALKEFGDDCLSIRYEDLCDQTAAVLQRIAAHCGLTRRAEPLALEARFENISSSNEEYLEGFPDVPHQESVWRRFGYA